MRKIRLSDTDYSFFDEELSPTEFAFFSKHKETFCCMVKDQGKDFWTRFTIVFRSYTVRHGIIRDMPCDSIKIQSMLDQAFIIIHNQFVDAKINASRAFILDIALLAQNKDKFPYLDSRSFTKDPFYSKETRDVFRLLFGPPDQKTSYIQVYILSPVYLRFGGSVCRCLMKWINADNHDPSDDSYWTPPAPIVESTQDKTDEKHERRKLLCEKCIEDCGTMFLQERFTGCPRGPMFIKLWIYGDPRFNDSGNPLYNPLVSPDSDWRDGLEIQDYQNFVYYVKEKFGTEEDQCQKCLALENAETATKKIKKKKKKKNKLSQAVTGHDQLNLSEKSENDENRFNSKLEKSGSGFGENEGKKWPFSSKAAITERFVHTIVPSRMSGSKNISTGFRVLEIKDESTGCSETTITIEGSTPNSGDWCSETADKEQLKNLGVSAAILRAKIPNLPNQLELWRGTSCVVAVVNYEKEERSRDQDPTNFNLRVCGPNDTTVMSVMFQLLRYIGKRKQRLCPGWIIVVDDILTCIVLEKKRTDEQLRISIQKGFHPAGGLNKNINKTSIVGSILNNKLEVMATSKESAVTKQELIRALEDISEGIAMDLEDFVVMKDGTMIHLKTGGAPVIDIRGCSEREKRILNGLPIDINQLLADRKAEGPIWDLVTSHREKYDITFLPKTSDKPEVPNPFGILKTFDCCKSSDFAVIGYSSKELQADLVKDSDGLHWVVEAGGLQKSSQKDAEKQVVKKNNSQNDDEPVTVAKESSLKSTVTGSLKNTSSSVSINETPSTASTDPETKPVKKKPIKMVGPFNATPRNWALAEAAEKEAALKKKQLEKVMEIVAVQHILITSCSKPGHHGKGCSCCETKFTMQIEKNGDGSYNVRLFLPHSTSLMEVSCRKDDLSSTIRSALCQQINSEMPFLGVDTIDVDVREDTNGGLKINLNMFGYSREPPVFSFSQSTGTPSGSKKNKSRSKKHSTHDVHTHSFTSDSSFKIVTFKTKVSDVPFPGQRLRTEDGGLSASSSSESVSSDKMSRKTEEKFIQTEDDKSSGSIFNLRDAIANSQDGSRLRHKLLMMEKEALKASQDACSERSVPPSEDSSRMKPKQLRMEKQKLLRIEKEKVLRMEKERTKEAVIASKTACCEKSIPPSDGAGIRKLRCCSNCHTEEEKPKQFKKCQRCKQELIQNARYYCGKECQVSDWARHKQEHIDGSLL